MHIRGLLFKTVKRTQNDYIKNQSEELTMQKIKAIIKRPDEAYGHVTWIGNTLENFQRNVGGHIEPIALTKNLMLDKIEGWKRRGRPRMRWLDGITDSME